MSDANTEQSLELVRRVSDVEWRVGADAALLRDRLYTGSRYSIPITASELAVHREALRNMVEHRDLSQDGLTVLTAVQLQLELAFDDLDDGTGANAQATVDLDGTEVFALATAHLGAASNAGSGRDGHDHDETLHRRLGHRLLDRIGDETPATDVLPPVR
ncbi:MAG: hypothetical protein ACI9YT_001675 [Halobacteriales archaeon]|jgi:hypothetical protein